MAVIAGLTRNPVVAWHWIPDRVRDDKLDDRDDKTKGRGHSRTRDIRVPVTFA